jgi:hypothetical protein
MLARFGAPIAAVRSARRQHQRFHFPALIAIAAAAATLGGCMPATAPLAGADPADPSVKVARVGYHSTTAPYNSMRPSNPAPWGRDGGASRSPSDR